MNKIFFEEQMKRLKVLLWALVLSFEERFVLVEVVVVVVAVEESEPLNR